MEVAGIRKDAWYLKAHPPTVRPTTAIYPAVPTRRSDLDDKLLARAVVLAGGGVEKPEGDAGSEAEAAAAAAAAAAIESAAGGLLSGQHNAVGTAYHLLLKKSVRRQNAMSRAAPAPGTEKAASAPDLENVASIPKTGVEGGVIFGDSVDGGGTQGAGSRRGQRESEVTKGTHDVATESTPAATAAVRPLAFHNSTSNDSSTSSAQSAQLVTARRRKPYPSAQAAGGVPLRAAAAVVTAQDPTPPVSKVAVLRPRDELGKVQPQPANGSRRVRSPTVPAAGSIQGVDDQRDKTKGDGARVTLAAGEQSEGSRGRVGGGGQVGPVPVLSFRKITRMGSGAVDGSGGGGSGRPATSSAFSSQTARTSGGIAARQETAGDSANRRRGGRKYAHRDSAGAGSIGRNATNGRGGNTVVIGAPPRRPLTARAPLKSSAPTPRLSGEFSLTRPRGSPVTTTGRVEAGAAASPSASNAAQGIDRSAQAGVPVAAESSAAPFTETRSAAGTGVGGSTAPAAVSSHTTGRQPSLRVRLSTLSSKGPQRRRFSRRGGGAPVGTTTVSAATTATPATTAAAATAAAAAVERKSVNSSRSSSRRSSLPSTSSATPAVAAAATAAAPPAGVGSVRALWGKKSAPNGSSGIRTPQAPGKSWTRGGPIAFRHSIPSGSAAIEVVQGGTSNGSNGRGQGGG